MRHYHELAKRVVRRVDALNSSPKTRKDSTVESGRKFEVCMISGTGPNGTEGDFADERYWLSTAYVVNNDSNFGRSVRFRRYVHNAPYDYLYARTFVGTNLAEKEAGTHTLAIDTPVLAQWLPDANGYPRWVFHQTAPSAVIQQFRVETVEDDILICRTWDGFSLGDVLFQVAKPFKLRRTPFDGLAYNGIRYDYTSNVERKAYRDSDPDKNETQVIIPRYETVSDESGGAIIYAMSGVLGGLSLENYGDAVWIDMNLDARAWAKKQPEGGGSG